MSIQDETDVWVTSESQHIQGQIISRANNPRSYVIEIPSGELQRNRTHLNIIPEQQPRSTIECPQTPASPRRIVTRYQTGTACKPADRLAQKGGCGVNYVVNLVNYYVTS